MSRQVAGDQGAYLTGAARAEYVRSLFARIVPRYDLFTHSPPLARIAAGASWWWMPPKCRPMAARSTLLPGPAP